MADPFSNKRVQITSEWLESAPFVADVTAIAHPWPSPPPRGALIAFEGIDRSGASTQSRRAVEFLRERDVPVELIVFPDRTTTIGGIIDRYQSEIGSGSAANARSLHMLFSANRWECAERIRALLARKVNVVVDSYAYSGVAYSVAKGLEWEWCRASDRGLPSPDVVIFMDLPPNVRSRPEGWAEGCHEIAEFQRDVERAYNVMKGSWIWQSVDAAQDVDDVSTDVMKIVHDTVVHVREVGPPLGTL